MGFQSSICNAVRVLFAVLIVMLLWLLVGTAIAVNVWLWAGGGDLFVRVGQLLFGPVGLLLTLGVACWYTKDIWKSLRFMLWRDDG